MSPTGTRGSYINSFFPPFSGLIPLSCRIQSYGTSHSKGVFWGFFFLFSTGNKDVVLGKWPSVFGPP